ncbi:hypothetical protein OG21DRAFT_1499957 [Imleria badia]|nr:hypothetical protein OG21DRAFT_1499957 [Imleria badia]
MASDKSSSEQKHADVRTVEGQAPSPEIHIALQRKLKRCHVSMVRQVPLRVQLHHPQLTLVSSIGGVIGTGLFFGTAPSLMNGGPLGVLLVYLCAASHLSSRLSLGEMTVFLPLPGGFIKLAERFVDPAFAFATGWNYWYGWTLTLPAELSAAAAIIGYWDTKTNPAVWITVFLVVAIGINALGVGAYGEAEFWLSSIKVITITGLIILGIIVDLGGGPNHDRVGFRYWKNPGPFTDYHATDAKGHFLGTCSVITQAAFSFLGTEAVAKEAGEARNPRQNIPKAIKRVYLRVLLFYIGAPSLNLNSTDTPASPFVTAFKEAGIKGFPSIINAAILTAAWSASLSALCLASRSLYGLSIAGSAPKIFSRTTSYGLPYVAVGVCSCFVLFAYLTLGDGSGKIFSWFSNFSSTAGLVTWFSIGVTYLRFYNGLKAQGIDRKTLPFAPRVQPFAGWWCVCGSGLILFVRVLRFPRVAPVLMYLPPLGNWSTITFVTDYIPIIFFPIMYIVAKFVMGAQTIKAVDMDFKSNVAEFDAMIYEDPGPKNKLEAFWMWLVRTASNLRSSRSSPSPSV